jgi:hypothetical protein
MPDMQQAWADTMARLITELALETDHERREDLATRTMQGLTHIVGKEKTLIAIERMEKGSDVMADLGMGLN